MTERTLVIIKPDALCKKVVGKILYKFEENHFKLIACKMIKMNKSQAEDFYEEHKGKEFYEPLVNFMSSNPIMVMVWEGENIVEKARKIIGHTDPTQAEQDTIRKIHATDNRHNAVHGSDSVKSAEREIAFFFIKDEIFIWQEKEYKK